MADYRGDISYGTMTSAFREGDVPTNNAGRNATTPFSKGGCIHAGQGEEHDERVDGWLRGEAIAEAKQRGDDVNLQQFEGLDPKSLTPSDRNSIESYLFDPAGNQAVPRSPLKGIGAKKAEQAAAEAQERMKQPMHDSRKRGESENQYQERLAAEGWTRFADGGVTQTKSPDLELRDNIAEIGRSREKVLRRGIGSRSLTSGTRSAASCRAM